VSEQLQVAQLLQQGDVCFALFSLKNFEIVMVALHKRSWPRGGSFVKQSLQELSNLPGRSPECWRHVSFDKERLETKGRIMSIMWVFIPASVGPEDLILAN
jgi:hypothetical protein